MKDFKAQSSTKSIKKCDDRPTVFVSAAFRDQCLATLKGAPLSIHFAYQSYANKEGIAWPSLGTLVKVTGYGINAVKRGKQMLIEIGLLTPIEQKREGGQFGRKKFRVNTVAPKQCHGTVALKQCSTVALKQCQEGFPSEGFPIEVEEGASASSRLAGGGSPLPDPTPTEGLCETSEAWKAVGGEPCGSSGFVQIWQVFYASRKPGEPLSVTMERAIQSCQDNCIKVPPPFFAAKRSMEKQELEASGPGWTFPKAEVHPL